MGIMDKGDDLRAERDELRAQVTARRDALNDALGVTEDCSATDGWVPVGVRLPMDLLPRIVVGEDGHVFPSRVMLPYGSGKWLDFDGQTMTTKIKAWRELPAPPKE